MAEQLKPTIGFGVDDVNSGRCLTRMETLRDLYEYPFQASVIVTNDKEYMNIHKFAREFRSRVKLFAPVVHVSLVTGDAPPNDTLHFFGEDGAFHNMLHALEHTPGAQQPAHFIRHMNREFRRLIEKKERYIMNEVHRQIDVFERLFKTAANGISYHYGLHKVRYLIGPYAQAARERNLPYRFDAKRAGTPRRQHVHVFDSLNFFEASSRTLLRMLDTMKSDKDEAEVMLHLGQHKIGDVQEKILMDYPVRNAFQRFTFALPSDMWRRAEYPEG